MTLPAQTNKTAALFGVGPGLGTSLAFKFGRAGYRVALVARRAALLKELVATLAAEGIEAAALPADLTHIAGLPRPQTSPLTRNGLLWAAHSIRSSLTRA